MQEAISVKNKNGVPVVCIDADRATEAAKILRNLTDNAGRRLREMKKEDEPVMPIVKSADKADKNKKVQVEKTFENVGKKMATKDTKPSEVGGIAVDRLRSLIERVERLEEEKKALSSDITDIFAEAKSAGFDTKIMRAVIKLRSMSAVDRDSQEFLLDTYKKALDL